MPTEHARASATVEPAAARITRRCIEIVVSVLTLLLASPILLLAVVAVRIETKGSPLFRQRRVGLDGEIFTLNKLRTMRADADPAPHREYIASLITESGPAQAPGTQVLFKLTGDDRVTRVGRILRLTSIDELPQLWNVLRGEMALVGPRPVPPYELDNYPERFFKRFTVKPGITGLWQTSGRNARNYHEMIELDLEYVENRTLLMDLGILARTPWAVLTTRGVA